MRQLFTLRLQMNGNQYSQYSRATPHPMMDMLDVSGRRFNDGRHKLRAGPL
jgi:hypothetical protein